VGLADKIWLETELKMNDMISGCKEKWIEITNKTSPEKIIISTIETEINTIKTIINITKGTNKSSITNKKTTITTVKVVIIKTGINKTRAHRDTTNLTITTKKIKCNKIVRISFLIRRTKANKGISKRIITKMIALIRNNTGRIRDMAINSINKMISNNTINRALTIISSNKSSSFMSKINSIMIKTTSKVMLDSMKTVLSRETLRLLRLKASNKILTGNNSSLNSIRV